MAVSANEKMQNYVNVTHVWNFGTPSIFETIEAR